MAASFSVTLQQQHYISAVADPEILKARGGAVDNVSASSSFIANITTNYIRFIRKMRLIVKKISANRGRGWPHRPPPLNPSLHLWSVFSTVVVSMPCPLYAITMMRVVLSGQIKHSQADYTGWSKQTDTHFYFWVMLVTVTERLKSVLNYRSYSKNKTGYPIFWTTLYR